MATTTGKECSIMAPCHNCDYCSEYYRNLYNPYGYDDNRDYAEEEYNRRLMEEQDDNTHSPSYDPYEYFDGDYYSTTDVMGLNNTE
jgi:hypothetical protein